MKCTGVKLILTQPQRSVTTLENPERFKQEMEETGLHNIEMRSVTKAFPAGSTTEFRESLPKRWQSYLQVHDWWGVNVSNYVGLSLRFWESE